MNTEDKLPTADRVQTDESLRVERAKADDALVDQQSAIDETADEVISRARARADEVLATARAKTDRQTNTSSEQSINQTERKRAREDEAVREERAEADEAVRAERAEHTALLSAERDETDKDLSFERTRSDTAVATRDDFLGIVSHDLRNMLSGVVGFAGLIAQAQSLENHEAVVRGYVQRIQRSGARMNRLIGDLVDVASIEAGSLGVTREIGDPTPVVAEAVDSFQAQASAKGVSLRAEFTLASSLVAFDPARVLQVLTNLLSNAIKFTPVNGQVIVRLERVANELRFAVSDTGIGIPADKLTTVFERFRQLAPNDRQGVGLGLYISKCIVQGHGGRIWAESKVAEGSTFYFTLPMEAG
ncbi:MAG TPA: ATP-binding protein [Polyangiaceae bacterium]|nr:ATP-binding protein [Polyangiaceae bacterium]